jgi:hypothetical protein
VVQRLATSPAWVSTKARHGGSQCTVAPSARLPGVMTAPSEGHAAQGGRQAGGTSAPRQRPSPPPSPGVAAAGSSMEDWEEGFFSEWRVTRVPAGIRRARVRAEILARGQTGGRAKA